MALRYVLFPGRHHVMTRFQSRWLQRLVAGDERDRAGETIAMAPDARVVVAVTSWDHAGTRRNPLPGHRREAAIEQFGRDLPSAPMVIPVPNVTPTPRFAEVLINAVDVSTRGAIRIDPSSTVVASSTPSVIAMFETLGYRVATVEQTARPDDGDVAYPWDLVNRIADGEPIDAVEPLHPASADILRRYRLDREIIELFADPLLGDEGDLTETRDYASYQASFDDGAERKYALVADHIRPGRIVDIGCGSGSLLRELAKAPDLAESDLFGIEASRTLFDVCMHRRNMGDFLNENTFFHHRNVLRTPVLAPASVDTTITMALTHEVFSYVGPDAVETMAAAIHTHTRPGGVWINADVCGPDDPDTVVEFDLATDDGHADHDDTPTDQLPDAASYLGGLSTWGLWRRFARDFRAEESEPFAWERISDGTARATRRNLWEFLTKKDYHQSWLSEMHERFCYWSGADWFELVDRVGFRIAPGSRTWTNEWIIKNRVDPVCRIRTLDGTPDPAAATHILLVGVRDGL